jgi:DNA repair protein RecN (Recombination protein N)
MLKRLYIRNFALIKEMDVEFSRSLTVITGETGAGKSIFLEALGLVLGKRADVSTLQDKTKKCIIEAEFEISEVALRPIFEEQELEFESPSILRREISPEGKSRSFLNDSPVSLQVLKQLSAYLIDIHSQHEILLLNDTRFRFDVVDAFAENNKSVELYRKTFSNYQALKRKQTHLMEQEQQAQKEIDYVQFLVNELNEVSFQAGDIKRLEEESAALENVEQIKSHLTQAVRLISSGENNIVTVLNQAKQNVASISKYNTAYNTLSERLQSTLIELKDISAELEAQEDQVELNPSALQLLNEKLDTMNRLLKKHQVQTEEALLQEKEKLEQRLIGFQSLSNELSKNDKAIATAFNECDKLATDISKKRASTIPFIEREVQSVLIELAMPNAQFKIEMTKSHELREMGYDEFRVVFSANKGAELKELQKVASGGELSRLMLALKSLLASKKQLPTIIFDEIDTGVSGEVANKIGLILHKMGSKMQVITITHLPQMAGKGQHHLYVYKQENEDQTLSYIKTLNKEERIHEIAKMLSTNNPSSSALKSAKELLN